jgi:hypothetical protein
MTLLSGRRQNKTLNVKGAGECEAEAEVERKKGKRFKCPD